jgi:hypothetical protein
MEFYAAQINRHLLAAEHLIQVGNHKTRRPKETDVELRKREQTTAEQTAIELALAPMVAAMIYILQFLFDGDVSKHYRLMRRQWKLKHIASTKTQIHPRSQYGDAEDSDRAHSEDESLWDESEDNDTASVEDEVERLDNLGEQEEDGHTTGKQAIGLDMERILRDNGMIWLPERLVEWDAPIPQFRTRLLSRIAFNVGGGFGSALQGGMKTMVSISGNNSMMMVLSRTLADDGAWLFGTPQSATKIINLCAKICVAKCAERLISVILGYYVCGLVEQTRARRHAQGKPFHPQEVIDMKQKQETKWHKRSTQAERDGINGLCPQLIAKMLGYFDAEDMIFTQGSFTRKGRIADIYYTDGSWVNRVFGLFNWTRSGQCKSDPYEVRAGLPRSTRNWDEARWRDTTKEIYTMLEQKYDLAHANWFVDTALRSLAPKYILVLPNYEKEKLIHFVDKNPDYPSENPAHRIRFLTPVLEPDKCPSHKCPRVCVMHHPDKALYLNLKSGAETYIVPGFPLRDTDTRAQIKAGAHVINSLAEKARCRYNIVADREKENMYVITNAGTWGNGLLQGIHTLKGARDVFEAAEAERVM